MSQSFEGSALLLPTGELRLTALEVREAPASLLTVTLVASATSAPCPTGRQLSTRIHSTTSARSPTCPSWGADCVSVSARAASSAASRTAPGGSSPGASPSS